MVPGSGRDFSIVSTWDHSGCSEAKLVQQRSPHESPNPVRVILGAQTLNPQKHITTVTEAQKLVVLPFFALFISFLISLAVVLLALLSLAIHTITTCSNNC